MTFNNGLNGVFRSQVIDTAAFLEREFGISVRIVALVSIRSFWKERRRLKQAYHKMTVVPMIPGVARWRLNLFLLRPLFLFLKCRLLIGRAIFAASLGVALREKGLVQRVVFDGRAATAAEWEEYEVGGEGMAERLGLWDVEREAVLRSDQRIAVSHQLLNYWKECYGHNGEGTFIIPSTLSLQTLKAEASFTVGRKELGFEEDDLVLVYAGSSSDWQSLDLLDRVLLELMEKEDRIKALLLSDLSPDRSKARKRFGQERVKLFWVQPEAVKAYLEVADYGLLLRESSITNRVASPTKFAEYLSAGLYVLINEGIGDLSSFAKEKECGTVIRENKIPNIEPDERPSPEERERMKSLAGEYFCKAAYRERYRSLIEE